MSNKSTRVHSFKNDALGELDAVALTNLIKQKEVSTEEVVKASIDRAQQVEGQLRAIVTDCFEKGLAEGANPRDGYFSGVPIFIKDLTLIEGIPTYFGTEAMSKAKASTKTDPIAKQIFDQGFIHLGNSSLPEFGLTCSTEFPNQAPTCNPWNTKYSVGGSSGGAAALVAAGVVPIAHTADGGGSTRIPAACSGIVGLKASRGRLLKSSAFEKGLVDIAIDGVVTRSVRDTAYFYAEAEKYYKNPKLPEIGLVTGPSKRCFKIGFTGDAYKAYKGTPRMMTALEKATKLLESMGHEVKPIQLPFNDNISDDFSLLWALSAFFVHRFGKQVIDPSFDSTKLTKLVVGLSKQYGKNFLKTPLAVYRLRKTYHQYAAMFEDLDIDFILTPTLGHETPELGYLSMNLEFEELFDRMKKWACFTPYSNATGGPSISLPMDHDETTDLPIGMMLWSNHGQEKLLLDLAYQLEEAKPWKKING